jgi:hypothetical protein
MPSQIFDVFIIIDWRKDLACVADGLIILCKQLILLVEVATCAGE